jgi:hypothetical protein
MKPLEAPRRSVGPVEVSETIPCLLGPPATLRISVKADSPDVRRGDVPGVVGIEIDDLAFELVPDSSINLLEPAELPRIRLAVLAECEKRLRREIAALEAALSRNGGDDAANGSEGRAAEARDRALRQAGRIGAVEPPATTPGPLQRVSAMPAGSYVASRWERGQASYLPQLGDGHATWSLRSAGSASLGRGAYISALPSLPQARSAAPAPVNQFPAPTRPGSSEHAAGLRLLRCKDLLRALRAK